MEPPCDPPGLDFEAPHQSIILIKCDVMQQLSSGMTSGQPTKVISKIVTVLGKDRNECITKTQEFIKEITEISNKYI